MKVVALDIATKVGVAWGDHLGQPSATTVDLGKAPDGLRFSNVLRLVDELVQTHAPDLIVAEAAVGGPKASKYLIGLLACAEGQAWLNEVRFELAHLGSIRKHFLGKSLTQKDFPGLKTTAAKQAIKNAVIQRCAILGWPVRTHDEADALALWDYGCATYARGYQSVPGGDLFHGDRL